MGTYAGWRSAADSGDIRKVTWVCGEQRVLVEEVVDATRTALQASDLDYVSVTAAAVPDREVWAAANQYPMTPGANRLILVRDAEKIKNWEPLSKWIAEGRRLPTVHLLFVGREADFPHVVQRGKKVGFQPHIEAIRGRGRLVRCSTPNEADCVAWVKRRSSLDDRTALYLLQRAGGNLATVASVCAKVSLFNRRVGPQIIDRLCSEVPADSFVDALLMLKKRQAVMAIEGMSESEYFGVIGLLDFRLDLMASLWRMVRAGQTARDAQGMPQFLVRQFLPFAKHYDPKRCAYARRVLAIIDQSLQGGARKGVLESLVALW